MIEYNKRDVTDGSGLIAAVRAAAGERYLGDLKVIDSLLRELAESELMQSIKSNMEALRLTLIASAVPKLSS